jgi:hypothetical protein
VTSALHLERDMTRHPRYPFIAIVAFCVLAHATRVSAGDAAPAPAGPSVAVAPETSPPPEGRELAGHVFMPALGIVGPFATTSFSSYMTLGAGSTEGHLTLQLPGNPPPPPQTFNGSVSYVAVGGVLGFEAQVVPGISARMGLTETIYSGTSGAAVTTVGTNARVGGGLGITAGLPIGNSVRVAGVVDANLVPRFGLLLGPAIESTFESCSTGIRDCRFDFSKLFRLKNVFELKPGVAASWAPLRALGISGNLSYLYASVAGISQGGIFIGVAVDYDFRAISRVPVGLQAALSSLVPITGHDSVFGYTDLGGGVFYTGRKHLSLGIQALARRFRVSPQTDVSWSTYVAFIGLRYYW